MAKGKTPPAPDYAGAAREQGSANVASGVAQSIMGRPNMQTPFGSQTWQQTGSTNVGGYEIPQMTGTHTLSPEVRSMFDRAFGASAQPFQADRAPGVAETAIDRNSARDALAARQEASIGRDRDNVQSDLVARGIPQGSEAWNREMDRLDRMTVDARQQAELGAGQAQQQAMQSRQQLIQEAMLNRQVPMNDLASILSGMQSALPQFGGGGGGPNIQPPNIMGATESSYGASLDQANARNAASANNTNAAASLIAAYLMAGSSDIRLKSNIVKVGEHPFGIGIYEYDIEGRRERGVMAQELLEVFPEAVAVMPSGYYGVYYDMIGGRP